MKKSYTSPTITVIDIDSSEVICASEVATIDISGGPVTQENYRTMFGLTGDEEIVAGAGGYRSSLWD